MSESEIIIGTTSYILEAIHSDAESAAKQKKAYEDYGYKTRVEKGTELGQISFRLFVSRRKMNKPKRYGV